jgi:hypothetical protein
VTPIGREIVRALHEMLFSVKLTLNVGRRNLKLHVNETGEGCFNRSMDMDEFIVGEIFQQIFLVTKQPISHEICYLGERDLNRPYLCFQITEYDFTVGSLNFQCLETNVFLRTKVYSTIFTAIMLVILPIYYLKLLFHLLSYRLFDIRYPKYYKLEESTMSPSSIVLEIMWKQQGAFAYGIRAIAVLSISLLFMCLNLINIKVNPWKLFNFVPFLYFLPLLPFLIFYMMTPTIPSAIPLHSLSRIFFSLNIPLL